MEEEIEIINIQSNPQIDGTEVFHSQKTSDNISYATSVSQIKEYSQTVSIVNFGTVSDETIDLDDTTYNTVYISTSNFITAIRLNVGCIGVGKVVVLTSNSIAGESRIYFNGTEARNENNLFSNNILTIEQGKSVSILCLNSTQFLIIGSVTNL